MKGKHVPPAARAFVADLAAGTKIKWFLEEGINQTSIEAKFRWNNKKYSIEFDTLGNLQDVEIQTKWRELPEPLKDLINSRLGQDCNKYKIQKVQAQYTGTPSVLLSELKTGKSAEAYTLRYELVVRCCNKKNIALYEYLFDDAGKKISHSKIVFKNSSNLEY